MAISDFTQGVSFPINKWDLADQMRARGANEQICANVERLPMEEFNSPAEVASALGEQD